MTHPQPWLATYEKLGVDWQSLPDVPEKTMSDQAIDFLPPSYHAKQLRVKRSIWRKSVLAVVLALITLGTLRQRDEQQELKQKAQQTRKLADEMTGEIHALAMKTLTPAQWREHGGG